MLEWAVRLSFLPRLADWYSTKPSCSRLHQHAEKGIEATLSLQTAVQALHHHIFFIIVTVNVLFLLLSFPLCLSVSNLKELLSKVSVKAEYQDGVCCISYFIKPSFAGCASCCLHCIQNIHNDWSAHLIFTQI